MNVIMKTIKTYGGERQVPYVEVPKAELDTLNELILSFINMEDFRKAVIERVEEVVNNDPLEYASEEGQAVLDRDNLVDQAIEHIYERDIATGIVPTIVYETVHETLDFSFFESLEDEVKEVWNDEIAYRRDPLGYYGMSQKDFL